MHQEFYGAMGQAVAERTYLRKKENGQWENWGDVANRVALGNASLIKSKKFKNKQYEFSHEYELLNKLIAKGLIITSGRHLQHGDADQPSKDMTIFTNCSTASTSFLSLYFLVCGSGVGRCYDDDMILVNWDYSPSIRCVLDDKHKDFDWSQHESVRDARHKYGNGKDILWYTLEDTREGWAKAVELWENAAFEKIHKDKMLILDFSKIRPKGSPISGMQGKPASGPVPLMNAFWKANGIKGAKLEPWQQAMYLDHYFAECVLVAGTRRSARIATKIWSDKTIFDFIKIKRPIEFAGMTIEQVVQHKKENPYTYGFLYSANNSVACDDEFWRLVDLSKKDKEYNTSLAIHARKVFKELTSIAYADGTGEPGILNIHKLTQNDTGWDNLLVGDYVGSKKFQINEDTQLYLSKLAKKAKKKKYHMIVNPCVTKDTWVATSNGPRQVADLLDAPFEAVVNGVAYPAKAFWKTGTKPVFKITTSRGYSVRATDNHQFLIQRNGKNEWVEVKDMKIGENMLLQNHENYEWLGEGNFYDGWLLGEMIGDGGHNPEKYNSYVRFWGKNKELMGNITTEYLQNCKHPPTKHYKGGSTYNDVLTIGTTGLSCLAEGLLNPDTKNITKMLETYSSEFYKGFLRGFFDADGTVLCNEKKGRSVRLAQTSYNKLIIVQNMLLKLGIVSSIYKNRHTNLSHLMPDGKGGQKLYNCVQIHELCISNENILTFQEKVGFNEPEKSKKLDLCISTLKRNINKKTFVSTIISIEPDGIEDVYDTTVDTVHCFDANGFIAHNCSEIVLSTLGGFCVIGDICPYFADSLEELEEAIRAITRFLMRVNTMDNPYAKEVARTNRIGIGLTGVHEFAWKFFKHGFKDLINEEKSKDFWLALNRMNGAAKDEAEKYAAEMGMNVPHTITTCKPSGSVSKLFGVTEGWHLPAMKFYLRYVQYRKDDPILDEYRKRGYPIKELTTFRNTTVVGFPTAPRISTLGMGEHLIIASEATPEEQYRWLQLGEKYWIDGVDESGSPRTDKYGNSISYTLKYKPDVTSYHEFRNMIGKYQKTVKCCSVMPQMEVVAHEYQPETPITQEKYDEILRNIETQHISEDIGKEHIECEGGACPIEFKEAK